MAIKKRNAPKGESKTIEALANELADKPYGEKKNDQIVRTTISLPAWMHEALEDLAISNKRASKDLKTVSAIVRQAVDEFMKK